MRMSLLAASIILASAICSAAPPQVKSFAPSVGWAGTTDENGTLVKISGGGFGADPKLNTVYFHPNIAAPVLAATPNESQYTFTSLYGGPGSGPGSLYNPIGLALRGLAVDPEDGTLTGSQLSWWLDGTIELGSGDALRLRQLPHGYANGVRLMMPFGSGHHTITLLATDSDGNRTAVQSEFDVVSTMQHLQHGNDSPPHCEEKRECGRPPLHAIVARRLS